MEHHEVSSVLTVTLAVLGRLAETTRTPADNLMVSVLRANHDRLTAAVVELLKDPIQPPPGERVAEVLASAGIKVGE